MKLTLRELVPGSVGASEVFGLVALLSTPDVEQPVLLSVVGAGILARGLGFWLGDRALRLAIALLLAAGAFFHFHDVAIALVVSRALVGLHALLWLPSGRGTYRFWRLGIAFLEIVLASILAPETRMFFLIFAFILSAFLALSFAFLERNFAERRPEALSEPVPMSFLGAIVSLSFVIFLSSLLIFPLLPRSNWSGMEQNWAETGYTETVSFREGILGWAKGGSRPMVWVFLPDGQRWEDVLPGRLLRGKSLDRFDGVDWSASPGHADDRFGPGSGIELELFREPMSTEVLPTPYGTARVSMSSQPVAHMEGGEWQAPRQRGKRVHYRVSLGLGGAAGPGESHLSWPGAERFPLVAALSRELGRGAVSADEKIRRVKEHFRGFRANLPSTRSAGGRGRHPVSDFLRSRSGHCELFATTTVLLLRSMGVPSRLVTGFRLGRLEDDSVAVARSGDAHAWAEAWTPERGWVALDTTPVVAAPSSWLDPARNVYELVSAYWYRYILGYEFELAAIEPWLRRLARPLAASFALAGAFYLFYFFRRRRRSRPPGRPLVSCAWDRLEALAPPGYFLTEAGAATRRRYLELRFGPRAPAAAEVTEFRRRAQASIREFSAR